MRLARLALPILVLAVPAWVVPAKAAPLVPHRAVYDLVLAEASDRSGITGIEGRMVYEFAGSACDGYTVTFRFVTRIDTEGSSRVTDQQTTTYEEGDGTGFSFVTRSFIDRSLNRELRGTARLTAEATHVSLEQPQESETELEATQFPTQHLLELLERAEDGETFYETTLFDASDDADRVMTTTVVIGRQAPPQPDERELEALAPLEREPFWPVDIAYFDLSEGEEIPTYRISFKLHGSGVTRDLVMDYGDFSMTGTLVDLSMFDPPEACAE